MHGLTFLQDLAVVMIVAGLVTVLCHRFRQPVVLGYILAGVIIGPHTPPFPLITDQETIHTLAELGIIFLMFSLGMEFSLRKLREVGATAFIAATLEILLMTWLGYEAGRLFGWSRIDSLFLGAMLAISSTTIIIKALQESGRTKEKFADLIFGILIVEDLLAIVMIALLSGIAMTGSLQAKDAAITLAQLGAFLAATLVVGLLAVPRLLEYISRFKSDETFLVVALGLCFGVSLLAVKFGYSVALGAFLIGAVVAESRQIGRIETLMHPVRDMFSAVFFVAIGLLIDPGLLVEHSTAVIVLTLLVVVGKVLTCSFGTFVAGNDIHTSLRVGMGLAQIGEFSFIIAALGLTLNVTSAFLYPIAVTVSAITTLLTPYLIQKADGVADAFMRSAPRFLTGYLELYSRWVSRLGQARPNDLIRRQMRRAILQMLLNLFLIAAIFIGAGFIGRGAPEWVPALPELAGGKQTLIWLAAALAALPLYAASFRKLEAVGMLLAEMSVPLAVAGPRAAAIRIFIARGILAAGLAGLLLFTLLLSSALLPPLKVLLVLLGVIVLVAALLWGTLARVYAKAQSSLHEVLSQRSPAVEAEPVQPLNTLLQGAELSTLTLSPGFAADGKLIRELQLRGKTGATIVGIERNKTSIVNPGPDETLLAGDKLFLDAYSLGWTYSYPLGRA